ncbi:hypothetical protein AALO_G00170320 [Alosa alosa]|uniref:Uncharacterized protein n=1 Tax=Alosa alosa TaxID=278164 RepID=A0AAV6GG07_9TELE|nr:hypothetical protein AALO_G00170320 [Alosa alosa]
MHRLICWGVLFAVQLHPISGWTKPVVSAQLSVMTVKDEVELHCDPQPPNTQWTCLFNSSSQKDLLTPTNKGHCTETEHLHFFPEVIKINQLTWIIRALAVLKKQRMQKKR